MFRIVLLGVLGLMNPSRFTFKFAIAWGAISPIVQSRILFPPPVDFLIVKLPASGNAPSKFVHAAVPPCAVTAGATPVVQLLTVMVTLPTQSLPAVGRPVPEL